MFKAKSSDKSVTFFDGLKNRIFKDVNIAELESVKCDVDESVKLTKENSEKWQSTIARNVSTHNDAFKDVEHSLDDHHVMHFIIKESLERFDKENFEKLTEFFHNQQVVAFQSESDGKFAIIWKKSNDEVYAVQFFQENINKEDLKILCKFILEFLNKCLNLNHSGLLNSSVNKFNIDLPSLADTNGLNLLFHAASNGNTKIIPVLLTVAFNVNMIHNYCLAIDYAYDNQHYEAVLVLLTKDSLFPNGFNINNCPNEDLKAFSEKNFKLHENIKANNLEEISKILSENRNLRHFYNINNQSSSAAAIANKKFEAYELLLQNNMCLSIWEEIEEITENLNWEEKREIREIHFRNKKDLDNHHLNVLMSKCSVGHDDEKVQERLNHVMRSFQMLNEFSFIKILLKVASLLPNLEIVFDFNRDSINYLDPTQDRKNIGLFYFNGRIYIGAKELLDHSTDHLVLATIAHELCHFVIYAIFGNMAKPYECDDVKTEREFDLVSSRCKRYKKADKIISAVYDLYSNDMHHAELIVRIPHFFAHYYNQPEMIEQLKVDFKSLFDFYEEKLIPKFENKIVELKEKAAKERKAKDKKISMLIKALIAVVIILSSVSILVGIFFYEPTYYWSKLDSEQKYKVLNGNVRIEGVDVKFSELYGSSDLNNGVFAKLTSNQIKVLLNDGVLNLNEVQNDFLQEDICLVYQNLTEHLREKVKNGKIEFQGQPVNVNSLLMNNTETFLDALDSTKIIKLAKKRDLLTIGIKLVNNTDFYVERKFMKIIPIKDIENVTVIWSPDGPIYETNETEKISSDLIEESLNEKIILLSDNAGNGKTTTFRNLGLKLKQKFPLKWIQFVDLKMKVDVYKKYQKTFSKSDELKILTEIFNVQNLDLEVFTTLYKENNAIILDGFDEIAPTYSNFMLSLMEMIKNNTQNIQFVSTRPHYENDIRDMLNCSVYELISYTKKENEEYLKKFYAHKNLTLSQKENAKIKVQELIERNEKRDWKNEENNNTITHFQDYIKSPLLLEMIAELSLNDDDSFDTSNLYTIYESFINKKLEISNDKGKVVQDEKNRILYNGLNLKEIFQYFAVYFMAFKLKISQKYINTSFNTNELSRYGILVFDSEGSAQFVHRTFFEFFMAQYIVENVYNMNGESDCEEIERRLIVLRTVIHNIYPKVEEFLLGYLATNGPRGVDKNLMTCFRTKLNDSFYQIVDYDFVFLDPFVRAKKRLQFFPYTSESLEILWRFDENTTYFNWMAVSRPDIFSKHFYNIQELLAKYFSTEKQRKFIYGNHQLGNVLYAVFTKIDRERESEKFDFSLYPSNDGRSMKAKYHLDNRLKVDKFLELFNVSADINPNELKNISIVSEYYNYIKPHLTNEEIRELFVTNFVDILAKGDVKIWNEIKAIFTRNEIQEMLLKGTINENEPTLYSVRDIEIIKLLFKALEDISDSKFLDFIRDDYTLYLQKKILMVDDNLKYVWNLIKNKTSETEKREILKLDLLDGDYANSFNLFSTSIELGTAEKFKEIKNLYETYFNLSEMRELVEEYLKLKRDESWQPNIETAQVFIDYLKSLFTSDEIENQFDKELNSFIIN